MTVRAIAVVSGHVQGVGYRYFVRGLATGRGLAGSARNLPDGRVEVVLEGTADDVDAVLTALSGFDAPGTVRSVDVRHEPATGIDSFTTG